MTYLEEIGHATVKAEGTKKLYRITDEGQRYLDQNRAVVDAILSVLGGKMERIRRVFTGQESPGGDEDEVFYGSDELRAARRTLKMALHQSTTARLKKAGGSPKSLRAPPRISSASKRQRRLQQA